MSAAADNERAGLALLTPTEMGRADQLTIDAGTPGIELMERAGSLVADAVRRNEPSGGRVLILCGPGNNGGDGFVAARLLKSAGYEIDVWLLGRPDRLTGDARLAFKAMGEADVLAEDADIEMELNRCTVVVDALFGAGLDRPLKGQALGVVEKVNAAKCRVVSVDLPSGINGASGKVMGAAIKAQETVTFFRLKPGHLLAPGRFHCGSVVCGQIGIPAAVLAEISPKAFRNAPALWQDCWRGPRPGGHKYDRGHAVVFSGGMTTTGAARLAAGAALRAGAGLVTVGSPPNAVLAHAAHLTAVMLRSIDGADGISAMLSDPRLNAALIGPGFGVGEACRAASEAILNAGCASVLDADALTSFENEPDELFRAIGDASDEVVLTPHAGEFARLFPDLASMDKLAAARCAADRSQAVIVLKGADTVIAAPGGVAALNNNAPPWLATAGSGDVLAGIVTGLLAQALPAFEAASMGVWLHGAAGAAAGPGLIAEDLCPALKHVIADLVDKS